MLLLLVAAVLPSALVAAFPVACGGFIQADWTIDYTGVEVQLLTVDGSLKYQSGCAPHNGYYSVPVYNHGQYILKVRPPAGWTFEQDHVDISINGKEDACAKQVDINFKLKGYLVKGRVLSAGSDDGPAGVHVELLNADGTVSQKSTTGANGEYTFVAVPKGMYSVAVRHLSWNFDKNDQKLEVTGNTDAVAITVRGYTIAGSVVSEERPISGVSFLLFGSTRVQGCETVDIPALREQGRPLCVVQSNMEGLFSFNDAPPGKYRVMPHYAGERTNYDVHPKEFAVVVGHGSVVIERPFEVAGFGVRGRVLTVAGGDPVNEVAVILNGKTVATSDSKGYFLLESMKSGTIALTFSHRNYEFAPHSVFVSSDTPTLEDIVAHKYAVCGVFRVSSAKAQSYSVIGGERTVNAESESSGKFCTFLPAASYVIKPILSVEQQQAGFQFRPVQHEVLVTSSPVTSLMFEQLLVRASGRISCTASCPPLTIRLSSDEGVVAEREIPASKDKSVSYDFDKILPGKYKVSVDTQTLCFEPPEQDVDLHSDTSKIDFTQTGFRLLLTTNFSTGATFRHEKTGALIGPLEFDSEKLICLPSAGLYIAEVMDTCARYLPHEKKVIAGVTTKLAFQAVQFKVRLNVMFLVEPDPTTMIDVWQQQNVNSVNLDNIHSHLRVEKTQTRLLSNGSQQWTSDEFFDAGIDATFTPQSELLMFTPANRNLVVEAACPFKELTFVARSSLFVAGKITPPVTGVEVSLQVPGAEDQKQVTTAAGTFKFGPLSPDTKFTLDATKEGYIIKPAENGHDFAAYKLAGVSVSIRDGGQLVAGALLSISSDSNYRQNTISSADSPTVFIGLGPGKYYVKAMLKEYEFKPADKFVDLVEGQTIEVVFDGIRASFSAFGRLLSPNGDGEPGLVVEARPSCDNVPNEEDKTDETGSFRIRGLHAGCRYDIVLKDGVQVGETIPGKYELDMGKEDVRDISLLVLRRSDSTDVSAQIHTDAEMLPLLRLSLFKAGGSSPIHTVNAVATSHFVFMPSVPAENESYVLRLDSTLNPAHYAYAPIERTFRADAQLKHIVFHFKPELKAGEMELSSASVLILPALGVLTYLVYQKFTSNDRS